MVEETIKIEVLINNKYYKTLETISLFTNVPMVRLINDSIKTYLETLNNGPLEQSLECLFGTSDLIVVFETIRALK